MGAELVSSCGGAISVVAVVVVDPFSSSLLLLQEITATETITPMINENLGEKNKDFMLIDLVNTICAARSITKTLPVFSPADPYE